MYSLEGEKWILLCIPDKSISTAGHNILKCVPTVLKTIPKLWGGKLVLSSAARVQVSLSICYEER